MINTNVIIDGMVVTVLLLAASALVLTHIRMYMDWQEEKQFKAAREALFNDLREAAKHEAGNY